MSDVSGRTVYWPKDADWWSWEYVVDLGEEFGPAGPAVYDYLWCQAKKQNEGGYVKTGYRSIARAAFTDVVTVRHVLSRASRIGALNEFEEGETTLTCRVSGFKKVNDRGLAAQRKAAQRARDNGAVEPNGRDGQAVTGRDSSRPVTPGHAESREVKKEKRTTGPSPDPSHQGGERPQPPVKPSNRRKRDLAQFEQQMADYVTAVALWAPHVTEDGLNGLAEPWAHIRGELQAAVSESAFAQSLAGLHPHRIAGDQLVLGMPPGHNGGWVHKRYGRLLIEATRAAMPSVAGIDLIPCPHTGEENR